MNILFEEFPDSVCVNGENYPIETDFREWIRFIQLVEDDEVPWQIKCQLMMQWYTDGMPDDLEGAVYALGGFLEMRVRLPRRRLQVSSTGCMNRRVRLSQKRMPKHFKRNFKKREKQPL